MRNSVCLRHVRVWLVQNYWQQNQRRADLPGSGQRKPGTGQQTKAIACLTALPKHACNLDGPINQTSAHLQTVQLSHLRQRINCSLASMLAVACSRMSV